MRGYGWKFVTHSSLNLQWNTSEHANVGQLVKARKGYEIFADHVRSFHPDDLQHLFIDVVCFSDPPETPPTKYMFYDKRILEIYGWIGFVIRAYRLSLLRKIRLFEIFHNIKNVTTEHWWSLVICLPNVWKIMYLICH